MSTKHTPRESYWRGHWAAIDGSAIATPNDDADAFARIASLLRELADELDGGAPLREERALVEAAPPPAPAPKPKKKSAPKLRLLPEVEVDEVTRAKARRMLRRAGVVAS